MTNLNKKQIVQELFSEKVNELVKSARNSKRYSSDEISKLENYRAYISGMVQHNKLANESYDLLAQASAEDIAQYTIYGGDLEKIIERMKNFNHVLCEGVLRKEQVGRILTVLPMNFYMVNSNVPFSESVIEETPATLDVYHRARVISLYPQSGKRLSKAVVKNMDFPLRSDCVMDENIGLRCCYHPKLTEFGIKLNDNRDEIEIDIHKYSKDNLDK